MIKVRIVKRSSMEDAESEIEAYCKIMIKEGREVEIQYVPTHQNFEALIIGRISNIRQGVNND